MHPPIWSSRQGQGVALHLVLPRHALDAQLALALASQTQPAQPNASNTQQQAIGAAGTASIVKSASSVPGWLCHGSLVLQPGWPRLSLLVAGLQAGPPLRLPPLAGRPGWQPVDVGHHAPPRGLALIYLAGAAEAMPASAAGPHATSAQAGAAWDAWLARLAPEHRLATLALVPDLAVLWLRPDGLVAGMFHPGDAWAGLQPTSGRRDTVAGHRDWQPIPWLSLPGAQMLQLALPLPRAWADPESIFLSGPPASAARSSAVADFADTEDADLLDDDATLSDLHGRYSRQAGALGPAVLERLQACRVALVGAGRIGSVLAHSLARMGCSLMVIEPDVMSPHSLDGDLAPLMEGRPKLDALQRQLRGLLRPGATLDLRMLPITSPAAGVLLADADIVFCAVDNDAARLWANAWALAAVKPLLVVATGLHAHGAEADLYLLPPGTGCLACCGGFAQAAELPAQLALSGPVPTPDDFRRQRAGSLRSWGVMSAHAGLRLMEHLVAGRIGHALMRRLAETATGGLQVQDWAPPEHHRLACPVCQRLAGAGLGAVQPALLAALAQQLAQRPAGGAAIPAGP